MDEGGGGAAKGGVVKTKIIEATSNSGNWGKFMVCRFTDEWRIKSGISNVLPGKARPPEEPPDQLGLLRRVGWHELHLVVLDLQTGEGAIFMPGGLAAADLDKHGIWVCPLFEPFLAWLYKQDLSDLDALPAVVEITGMGRRYKAIADRGRKAGCPGRRDRGTMIVVIASAPEAAGQVGCVRSACSVLRSTRWCGRSSRWPDGDPAELQDQDIAAMVALAEANVLRLAQVKRLAAVLLENPEQGQRRRAC